jgi:twitching motility protein PilT
VLSGVVYQRLLPKPNGGLVAAYEVMVGNAAVRNLVREGKTKQLRNVITTHQGEGMRTLEVSLNELIRSGQVDPEVARAASLYPGELDLTPPLALAGAPQLAAVGSGR